jgi:carbon starvation protein
MKIGAKSFYVVIPMVFMLVVTIAALCVLMYQNALTQNWLLAGSAFILFVLCIFLAIEGWGAMTKTTKKEVVSYHQ